MIQKKTVITAFIFLALSSTQKNLCMEKKPLSLIEQCKKYDTQKRHANTKKLHDDMLKHAFRAIEKLNIRLLRRTFQTCGIDHCDSNDNRLLVENWEKKNKKILKQKNRSCYKNDLKNLYKIADLLLLLPKENKAQNPNTLQKKKKSASL